MPLKTTELPDLNPPKPRNAPRTPEDYQAQNHGAMQGAIALRAQETAKSLQALDNQLTAFEQRFAQAAVNRIDQVPLRIEQAIAAQLQQRHAARQQPQILDVLDAFTVPDFELPPAIAPCTVAGALAM